MPGRRKVCDIHSTLVTTLSCATRLDSGVIDPFERKEGKQWIRWNMAPRLIGTVVHGGGTAAGCSQRVSLPVVFRLNRRFTLSGISFLSLWGGRLIQAPHIFLVATCPAYLKAVYKIYTAPCPENKCLPKEALNQPSWINSSSMIKMWLSLDVDLRLRLCEMVEKLLV